MQMKKAEELRSKRTKSPCKHETVVKEYFLGADTGDYACTTCGESQRMDEWKKEKGSAAEPEVLSKDPGTKTELSDDVPQSVS